MQINHNMGWNEIKGSFLINDKAGWNIRLSPRSGCRDAGAFPGAAPTQGVSAGLHPGWLLSPPHPYSDALAARPPSPSALIIWISGASHLLFALARCQREEPGVDRCTGNLKWQFWPPEVRSLQQNLVQPPGEMSGAPYGAGKINNKMKIAVAAGSLRLKKKKTEKKRKKNLKMRKEK